MSNPDLQIPGDGERGGEREKGQNSSKLLQKETEHLWEPVSHLLQQHPAPSVGCLPWRAESAGCPDLGLVDPGTGVARGARQEQPPAGRQARASYFTSTKSPIPSARERAAEDRYSLGLVGEPGSPGLLVSVQVTVEYIEAKAAHLR